MRVSILLKCQHLFYHNSDISTMFFCRSSGRFSFRFSSNFDSPGPVGVNLGIFRAILVPLSLNCDFSDFSDFCDKISDEK